MARRSGRIDALRGFAVFGILLVNVWAFVYGYSLYRYSLQDVLPLADQLGCSLAAWRPLRELAASLRILVVVNAMILLAFAAMTALDHGSLATAIEQTIEAQRAHAVYTLGGWSDIAGERLSDFGANLFGFFIFVPRLALLLGLAAGVPLNAWWALVALAETARPFSLLPGAGVALALLDLAGPVLGAAYVAAFMLMRERLLAWLVPVGKMALTNYLTQSLLLSLLLQGCGLGLGAVMDRAQLLGLCFGVMLVQLMACRWWLRHHAQGPLEAVWRRYIHAPSQVV